MGNAAELNPAKKPCVDAGIGDIRRPGGFASPNSLSGHGGRDLTQMADSKALLTRAKARLTRAKGELARGKGRLTRATLRLEIDAMRGLLTQGIIAFEESQALIAAALFNAVKRSRRLRVDAMIAAVSISKKAPLATLNTADFGLFVPFGLELASPP